MREWDFGQIQPGMEVADSDGQKVGTVAHIHRAALVAAGDTGDGAGASATEDVVEVKSGLFGLGAHYYVPASAIRAVSANCVFLTRARDEFGALGWGSKPAALS